MQEKILIGKQIKRLRTRLSLTQDRLAEKVQISPKYLSNIERGKENPTLETLIRLSASLKVELWEVFFADEEQSKEMYKKKILELMDETSDEKMRLVVRLLQAALH